MTRRGAGSTKGCLHSPQSSQGEALSLTPFSCLKPPTGFILKSPAPVHGFQGPWDLAPAQVLSDGSGSGLPLLPQALFQVTALSPEPGPGLAHSWLSADMC